MCEKSAKIVRASLGRNEPGLAHFITILFGIVEMTMMGFTEEVL